MLRSFLGPISSPLFALWLWRYLYLVSLTWCNDQELLPKSIGPTKRIFGRVWMFCGSTYGPFLMQKFWGPHTAMRIFTVWERDSTVTPLVNILTLNPGSDWLMTNRHSLQWYTFLVKFTPLKCHLMIRLSYLSDRENHHYLVYIPDNDLVNETKE